MAVMLTPVLPEKTDLSAADSPLIGPTDNGRLMTPDEFDALTREDVEEGYAYELINGVFIVSPFPGPAETDPNGELGFLLRLYELHHPGIIDKTLYETYIRTTVNRRRADRVIWIGLGRVPRLNQDVPAVAIEFLSIRTCSRQLDYDVKPLQYLNLGIQEFWLFDRFKKQLTVFHRRDGKDQEQVVAATESYRTPMLPEFELPVGQILSRADDWKQET